MVTNPFTVRVGCHPFILPFDLHGTFVNSISLSDSAPHSSPLKMIFSKLNQLECQMLVLQVATATHNGPHSKHNHFSAKHKHSVLVPVC